jgi:hypothetical protein
LPSVITERSAQKSDRHGLLLLACKLDVQIYGKLLGCLILFLLLSATTAAFAVLPRICFPQIDGRHETGFSYNVLRQH